MAQPFSSSTTSKNEITVTFDPAESGLVTSCTAIGNVQVVRILADGTPILPGTYYSGFAFKDPITTDAFWYVDILQDAKTPVYQSYAAGSYGSKNGGTTNAVEFDAPQTGGGDKHFYSPSTNPYGWKEVVYEFYTFCWCQAGTQCDSWYQGLSWTYTKTWEDQRDGNPGVAVIGDSNLQPPPSAEFLAAFTLFNSTYKYVPCSGTKLEGVRS